jgi:hypothetical protein
VHWVAGGPNDYGNVALDQISVPLRRVFLFAWINNLSINAIGGLHIPSITQMSLDSPTCFFVLYFAVGMGEYIPFVSWV